MKTLVFAIVLSILPIAAKAQTVIENEAQCQMVRFNDEILVRAKGEFEAKIEKTLRQKYGQSATYKFSEVLQIDPKSDPLNTDEPGEPKTDNYYQLTISKIRIETAKGRVFTLSTPSVTLRGEEAVWENHYDDEKAPAGQSCSVNFLGALRGNIINQETQQIVTGLGDQTLSVSAFVIVQSK